MTNDEIFEQVCGESVWSSYNGHGRGDGYDVVAVRLGSRYLIRATRAGSSHSSWYIAQTIDDARAVGAPGYTPGCAPGRFAPVTALSRLREVRAWMAACEATP